MSLRNSLHSIILSIFLLGLVAGLEARTLLSDSTNCPIPFGDTTAGFGRRIPPYYDMIQKLSPNGKMLAVISNQGDGGAFILNLQTLERKRIIINSKLPGEQDISWSGVAWCPYDTDLIALNVVSFVDTNTSGISTVYVENIFFYRISNNESRIVTPKIFSPYGGEVSGGDWTRWSNSQHDTLSIGYVIRGILQDSIFHGLYIPETQILIPQSSSNVYLAAVTPDGLDTLEAKLDNTGHPLPPYYLRSTQVYGPKLLDSNSGMRRGSFSPDGKFFVVWATPLNFGPPADSVFDELWIYKTSDPSRPIRELNFQKLYCMYSFRGIWPEFITDSTIAVSMHKDGDISSPLWEINFDGKIIRQLTFLPSSDVRTTPPPEISLYSVTSSPNPFKQETTLEFTLNRMAYTTVAIYDELGRWVWGDTHGNSLDTGGHTVQIAGSKLPSGTLYARISTGFGEVKTVKLVHEK